MIPLLQLKKKKLIAEGSSSNQNNTGNPHHSSIGTSSVPSVYFPPKKKIGNNFDPNFLEQRLAALDTAMQQLCDHSTIFQDEKMQQFLQPNREGDIPNAAFTLVTNSSNK
jgi:hypothetical protein